jgi:hypothetical protein
VLLDLEYFICIGMRLELFVVIYVSIVHVSHVGHVDLNMDGEVFT